MIALARFQLDGYVRSLRVLQPLVVIFLVVALVLSQWPSGETPEDTVEAATGTLGDVPAFLFFVWAWTARALLDAQPDVQRDLSAVAARRRDVPVLAGLLAAYTVNLVLGALALASPLLQSVLVGVPASALLTCVGLALLVNAAATALGAWTSRAVIPAPGTALLALLGALVAALLLGLGPLNPLAVPILDWVRAAHAGPAAFTDAYPGIALHLVLWTAVVGGGYAFVARRR
ncbi:hypothetical protein GCM10009678_08880 [Actinomadura kijaniata]|uniref:Uncharacterized protein n=1 Tax=Actinomadura namibiensis TaxID=182080 RepID=A0A7W3LJL9_ACTNM|nr:hypothetical protein [Actinomadura namibiensis]MBA8949369.1 hypothetical protein [Actinomadura namibiensis]